MFQTRKDAIVKEHEFTVILTVDPNEEEADRIYSILNDGTLSTSVGAPQIRFHRVAPSLLEAIRSAMADIRSAGFDIARVEIEPEAVAQEA